MPHIAHKTQLAGLFVLLVAVQASLAEAGGGGYAAGAKGHIGGCGCGHGCDQIVYDTIMVPQMVPETRTVHVTQYRSEPRQRTVTVHRRVPEVKSVTQNYTVMVAKKHTKTQTYTAHRQVWDEIPRTYTVHVPYPVKKQGVRTVSRPVAVQQTRTVCRDLGHWEHVTCKVPCGGCSPGCPTYHIVTRKVWHSNVVTEQVPVTVWKHELVQEPYEYTVMASRPEQRTTTVRVCRYVPEQRTREVAYFVRMPEVRTRTKQYTTYRLEPEQRVQTYHVSVPHVVEKQVTVMRCHMVPKTVARRIPAVPCGCGCW